ncbi:MAG TPA: coproporphyrinogen III oxidase, partial [Bacteroidales bacterium]|nr:coproporphyrinogen III oxidase [Bacteroidales bacterium]
MAGIYLHIPFCRKLCSYCDFYHVITQAENKSYVSALVKEAGLRREYLGNEIISTFY